MHCGVSQNIGVRTFERWQLQLITSVKAGVKRSHPVFCSVVFMLDSGNTWNFLFLLPGDLRAVYVKHSKFFSIRGFFDGSELSLEIACSDSVKERLLLAIWLLTSRI